MSTKTVPTVPPITLGWRLQIALDYANLKYGDIMDRFEVSRGTVSRWCRDIPPRPKRFILEEIAHMCGVSTDWLLGHDRSNDTDGHAANTNLVQGTRLTVGYLARARRRRAVLLTAA